MSTPELAADATQRFTGRSGDYVKYRPSYPREAIDAVFDGLGDPARVRAADIGAGTGISTRLLAARGADVVALEPNAEMRAAAERDGSRTHDGTAEATGLAAGAYDLVTMFQAFHWVKAPAALAEFKRILRPGGRIALVWNMRDDADAFTRGYGDIFDREREQEIAATFRFDWNGVEAALRGAGLHDVNTLHFAYVQRLDLDGVLGRARSASYVPLDGPRRDDILTRLAELHERFSDADGTVGLTYRTDVYRAHT